MDEHPYIDGSSICLYALKGKYGTRNHWHFVEEARLPKVLFFFRFHVSLPGLHFNHCTVGLSTLVTTAEAQDVVGHDLIDIPFQPLFSIHLAGLATKNAMKN